MGGLQKCSNSWILLLVGINIASWLELVLSAESRYEACKPTNCGSGPNISYPFYIQEDEPGYCGHPGFEIRCEKGWPRYRSSDADYIIQNITYESRSFRVVNAEVIDTTCPAPLRNYSFDRSSLDFSPCHANIYFFYNCSDSFSVNYTSSVPTCDSNVANGTFVALVPEDEDLNWTRTACQFFVAAPVQLNQEEINQTTGNVDYVKLLMDGFTLKWIGFGKNCGECRTSGGYCGFAEENGVCYCPDGTHSKHCNDGNDQRRLKLGLGLGFGVLILMTIFLLSLYVMWHCFRRRHDSSKYLSSRNYDDPSAKADLEGDDTYFGIPIFSHSELGEATDNFASEKELGDGGFGTVYYGKLQDGREVAVKRLYEHNYRRVEQFRNEIAILKRLRHKNLVSLYGCTSSHRRELLLVYEYISNGTVADHLHGDRAMSSPLTWPIRMRIAIETANALVYLHASDIIHRDVKTNNILLDSHFEVKVADFGLSRLFPNDATHVSTVPQGSPGYVDPEYQKFYQLTDKSDVYSFGVVLIELISSMPAVDISRHQEEINLSYLALSKIQMRAFDELIDPDLGYKSDDRVKRMTISVAELAFRCLQQDKETRPSMEKILEELKRIESREYGDNRMEVHDDSKVSKTVLPAPSPPSCDQTLLLKNPWVPPSPESLSDTQKTSSCSTSASVSS